MLKDCVIEKWTDLSVFLYLSDFQWSIPLFYWYDCDVETRITTVFN